MPIVAAAIGIWLAVTTVMSKGPLVDVTFITADGLEAGKTKVKYRDVDVGLVEAVHVTPDLTRVVVEARMEKSFAANVTERQPVLGGPPACRRQWGDRARDAAVGRLYRGRAGRGRTLRAALSASRSRP